MLLLITGCINVSDEAPFVKVKDSQYRFSLYLKTIKWALESTKFDTVVFCENSNFRYSFNDLINSNYKYKSKMFEYITFQGDVKKSNILGKGYGECEIINHAIRYSKYIKKEEYFWKITGKLMVYNVNDIIAGSNNGNYFNIHLSLEKMIDTRFYRINVETYLKYFTDVGERVNDLNNYYLENVFYKILNENKLQYRCFNRYPRFLGISGSTGNRYDNKENMESKILDGLCRCRVFNSRFAILIKYTIKAIKKFVR